MSAKPAPAEANNTLLYPGTIKLQPEDWRVEEIPEGPFTGSGEHAYFFVEKTNLTTDTVRDQLADALSLRRVDIGYAGKKDKLGITQQWFSAHSPVDEWPEIAGTRCLQHARHLRKLRIGGLAGNRFAITIRDCATPAEQFLKLQDGFPNRFGEQRLSGDNVEQAVAWLLAGKYRQRKGKGGKRKPRSQRDGWFLSVLRSYLFNTVLEYRLAQVGNLKVVEGDYVVAGFASAPMWGRGRSKSSGRAAEIEQQALKDLQEICAAMEFTGLNQDRRPLVVRPSELMAHADGSDTVSLSFTLPPGSYATSLLQHSRALC